MNELNPTQAQAPARRRFLGQSAALVGMAGAGLALAGRPAEAAEASVPVPEPENTGYRETEHVRRYYRMADF